MREQLIAYLLDDLDAEEKRLLEKRLRSDPQLRSELERLRAYLSGTDAEMGDTIDPPCDLTSRTCCLIQSESGEHSPVPAALSSENGECRRSHSWSMADVIIAASVLATLTMLLLPAIHKSREASRRLACQNNLRELGTALVHYAELQRHGLPRVEPNENAGIFAVELAERGTIGPRRLAELLVCPSSPLAEHVFVGKVAIRVPTRHQLNSTSGEKLLALRLRMGGSYAYRLGYLENGDYRHVRFVGRSDAPMLADAPCHQPDGFYSPNHGGCALVLFQDQSVRSYSHCTASDVCDHYYLNSEGKQAAGNFARDVVLGSSEVRPDGLTFISTSQP